MERLKTNWVTDIIIKTMKTFFIEFLLHFLNPRPLFEAFIILTSSSDLAFSVFFLKPMAQYANYFSKIT